MGLPILGGLFAAASGAFSSFAGWAVDSVIAAITTWVLGGVLTLIEAIWSVIDTSTRPTPSAGWFAGADSSPFEMAVAIGGVMLLLTTLAALVRAVLAGSPGGLFRAVGRDLPMAVLTMVATVAFASVALDLADALSDWVWAGTRDDAKRALDALSLTLMTGLPNLQFVAVALAIMVLLALVFLWVVLYVRAALLYVTIVLAAAFAWPMMVFPPLRDTAKKAGELLLALVICKPVITLALSVGVSAMGSLATNGDASTVAQLGTIVSGVVVFGLAAFMPFLVWKLLPVAAAAVVAQGVAGGPLRATQQGMQAQFYAKQLTSGGKTPGRPAGTPTSGGSGPTGGAPTGGAAGGGAGVAATGPAGVAVAAASMATRAVKNTATATAESAASGSGLAS